MKSLLRILALALCAMSLAPVANAADAKQPPSSIVSIYRIAPGKHLAFLQWMAAREAADKDAGVTATQWYAHRSGDSWDYVVIAPKLSDEQSDAVDAAAKKKGLSTGFAENVEFRTFIAIHTDTETMGPVSATELVAEAGK